MALILASNAITFTDNTVLSSGIVTAAQLSANSVTTDKIAINAITNEKIASNSVTLDKISQNSGAFSFKNKIINGNFDIWQRGTNFTAPAQNGYCADRWIIFSVGTSATITRQEFTTDQTLVTGNPTYFARINVTSVTGASNHAVLDQRIENARTFAGQTAILSFWAKADSPKNLGVSIGRSTGVQAINSGVGATLVSLTSSWQKHTVAFNMPVLSSTVSLTGDNHHIGIQVYFDAGTNYDNRSANLGHQSGIFDIAQVQLEEGTVATPFEQRPIGLELSLCQRYFEIIPYFNMIRLTNAGVFAWSGTPIVYLPFNTTKRTQNYIVTAYTVPNLGGTKNALLKNSASNASIPAGYGGQTGLSPMFSRTGDTFGTNRLSSNTYVNSLQLWNNLELVNFWDYLEGSLSIDAEI